jgi:outer membrane protein assembly factor BamB
MRVRGVRTTISCRSIPLILAVALINRGSSLTPFFPIATNWRTALAAAPSAPATTDSLHVFVPLRSGRLVALDVASGRERWSAELLAAQRPAVGDGVLFVANATEIRALDAATGAQRWQLPAGPLATAPVWRDGWLVAGTEAGEVLAVRAADGTLLWRRQVGRLSAVPTIDGDRLMLPLADGRIVLAALMTGEERWSRMLGGGPGPALLDDERVFVGARDNHFYCLDARDGAIRWRWRTAADIIGPAVVDADHVYFISLDNVLRALDRWHGGQRWRRPLPMRAFEPLVTPDGLIVVGGLGADVLFFNARDGAPAGTWSAGDQLGAPLVLTPAADQIRMVAIAGGISGEWMALGVGSTAELPLEPLLVMPGKPLTPEDAPAPRGS